MSGSLAGVFGHVITQDDVNYGLSNGGPSGEFYADKGAKVGRFVDRLLIGGATENPVNFNRSTEDWLSAVMDTQPTIGPWAVWGAQAVALTRYGTIGFLGASRTSDSLANHARLGYPDGNPPASIGVMAMAISDDTSSPTATTGWAFYGEAWKMPGADYQPVFGMELAANNFGNLATPQTTPYAINSGGGVFAIQLGSGGTEDAGGAISVVANPKRFQRGIAFAKDSLTGTNGNSADTGFGNAILMGRNQGITWYSPDNRVAVYHYSTVTSYTHGTRIIHQDDALLITDYQGAEIGTFRAGGTLSMLQSGATIEMGNPLVSNSAQIDGHTSGANIDYDSRIQFSGGDGTVGQGGIGVYASQMLVNANLDTVTGSYATFNGALTVSGPFVSTFSADFLYTTAFHAAGVFDYASGGRLNLINIPSFASNTQAASAGLNYGDVYRNLTTQALDIRT